MSVLPMGDVLCLAEGEGRNAVFLATTGRRVSSVDLTEAGVAKTLRLAASLWACLSARSSVICPSTTWAWTAGTQSSRSLPTCRRRCGSICTVASATFLRPGGVFLLEAYTPDQIGRGTRGTGIGGPDDDNRGPEERASGGLEFSCAEERKREIVEGTHHTGVGSVVQVIARKRV